MPQGHKPPPNTAPDQGKRATPDIQYYSPEASHDGPSNFRRQARIYTTRRDVTFIDGCFWHGCPNHYVKTKTNPDFWSDKVARN